MSLQLNLAGLVNNDFIFTGQILYQGKFLPLTGLTLSAVVKASRTATDGSGTAYGQGSGITITNAALGQFTWTIPHANTGTAGTFWYRIDVTNIGGAVFNAMFGVFTINAA